MRFELQRERPLWFGLEHIRAELHRLRLLSLSCNPFLTDKRSQVLNPSITWGPAALQRHHCQIGLLKSNDDDTSHSLGF